LPSAYDSGVFLEEEEKRFAKNKNSRPYKRQTVVLLYFVCKNVFFCECKKKKKKKKLNFKKKKYEYKKLIKKKKTFPILREPKNKN